jgi:hypothetical protein
MSVQPAVEVGKVTKIVVWGSHGSSAEEPVKGGFLCVLLDDQPDRHQLYV